jgi:hypothetical protein
MREGNARAEPQAARALHRREPHHIHGNEGSGTLVINPDVSIFWKAGSRFYPGQAAAVADGAGAWWK